VGLMLLLLPSRSAASAAGVAGMKGQQNIAAAAVAAAAAAAVYGMTGLLKRSTGVQRYRPAAADMLELLLLWAAGTSGAIDTAAGWVHERARGHCVCGPAAAVDAVTRKHKAAELCVFPLPACLVQVYMTS
jgi:nitrate reductase gamma subunit